MGYNSEMSRPIFSSRLATLVTMVGVAVGLGNIWRFPYMTGHFGGASFVLIYVGMVLLLGVPALMAEWSLGCATRRGPVGAFEKAGVPGGRLIGLLFFAGVVAATAYYTNAVGWVLLHALDQLAELVGLGFDASRVLPPEEGFDGRSFGLQALCSATVILACGAVLKCGLRDGIERAGRLTMPILAVGLAILIIRALTLEGSWAGVQWYLLKLEPVNIKVVAAAMGQAFFSLSLGGTFMVVYGSYLSEDEALADNALWTSAGDLLAGLLAGLAIIPAVFAFSLEPGTGPGLIFTTLPKVFEQIPGGALFGAIFFLSLLGAAFLSDLAAFEVLVAALIDELGWSRVRAIQALSLVVFLVALPPMVNLKVFVPWDLTFGSGFQTLGALVAVLTVGWFLDPAELRSRLGVGQGVTGTRRFRALLFWIRWVLPAVVIILGCYWLLSEVLGWIQPAA